MSGLFRRLVGLRGPAGVLGLAIGFGLVTGLVAAHLVLAAWTYRDAARRDLREPGRWALAMLVGGVFAFVPYVVLQRATDWSNDSSGVQAARRAVDRGRGLGTSAAGAKPDDEPPAETADSADVDGDEEVPVGHPGPNDRGERPEAGDGAVRPETRNGAGGSLVMATARYGWKAARLGGRRARWAVRELTD
jgi:hypothetical protein